MDNFEEFYLILPSNNSLVYYGENSTACFTTHLSREIRLNGEWSVGLAEIHVPCTIMHIQESEGNFELKYEDTSRTTYNIPYGIYENIDQLANEINNEDVFGHQILDAEPSRKGFYRLRRACACDSPHTTRLNEKIRRIFGFEDAVHRQTGLFVTDNSNTIAAVGNRPASLARAIPDQLFVYTDICVPYTVGDTQASLLRIVPLDNTRYRFGSNIVRHFAPIHYIPLLHHSFQSLIIDIRDNHGDRVPFEYGTLTVMLHFKRTR